MVALTVISMIIYFAGVLAFFFRMKSVAKKFDAQCSSSIASGLTLAVIIPLGLGVSGSAMLSGSEAAALTVATLSSISFATGLFLIPGAISSGVHRLKIREKEECNERFNQLMRQRVEEQRARAEARASSNKSVQPTADAAAD